MGQNIEANDDTIAALATAIGQGGIGIVRLSGPLSVTIIDAIFLAKNKKKAADLKSHVVTFGHIINPQSPQEIIDEVLVTIMRAPKSYTREDVVEVSCHGGVMAVKTVLELVLTHGARLAKPGEFTKRAFLNGRLDLVQAEAVLNIIQAKTQAFLRVSTHQLKGELTIKLEEIRAELLQAYIQLEALINFPEDDIEAQAKIKIGSGIRQAQEKIESLLSESHQGRLLKEGARVVLCGRPNVGKSSLLNILLKQPRAIVSEVAGTTRDTIEESAQIRGIPLLLVDTAGILEPRDFIEEEAVKRSRAHMQSADLVLLVVSAAEDLTQEDLKIIGFLNQQHILVVVNKCDLPNVLSDEQIKAVLPGKTIVRVSTIDRAMNAKLEEAIELEVLSGRPLDPSQILLTNTRHIEALRTALTELKEAHVALTNHFSFEFVCEHLKMSLTSLDRITGRDIDEDLIENIFSSFCIGK